MNYTRLKFYVSTGHKCYYRLFPEESAKIYSEYQRERLVCLIRFSIIEAGG